MCHRGVPGPGAGPWRRTRRRGCPVITGAASGIGLATLELLVQAGARVLAADVREPLGRALEQRLEGSVRFERCDVTQPEQIRHAIDSAAQHFGGLDILFTNAGAAGSPASVENFDAAAWDATQALLLRSVVAGASFAVPHMKMRGGGAIINTSSVSALVMRRVTTRHPKHEAIQRCGARAVRVLRQTRRHGPALHARAEFAAGHCRAPLRPAGGAAAVAELVAHRGRRGTGRRCQDTHPGVSQSLDRSVKQFAFRLPGRLECAAAHALSANSGVHPFAATLSCAQR